MRTIRVKTADLITKIEENRTAHLEAYTEAVEGYQIEALAKLKELTKIVKNGGFVQGFHLPVPSNYVKEYDVVLTMLRMSTERDIEIEERDFRKFVMDEWEWKHGFESVASTYALSAKALA